MKKHNSGKAILGRNLDRIRVDLGFSENEFSRRIGFADKTINNFINAVDRDRSISLDYIDEIAAWLGIDTWKLFIPDIDLKLLKSKELEQLLESYAQADNDGREWIMKGAAMVPKTTIDPEVIAENRIKNALKNK